MESVAIPQKLKRVIHALRQARSGITLMNRNRRGSKLNTARWQHIESMEQRQLLTNLVSLFVSDPLASETEPETPPDTGTFTINRTGTAADMAAEGAQKEGAQKVSEGAQKEGGAQKVSGTVY